MSRGGSLSSVLDSMIGTERGAGLALLYRMTSPGLLLVGWTGYACSTMRHLAYNLPAHDAISTAGGISGN